MVVSRQLPARIRSILPSGAADSTAKPSSNRCYDPNKAANFHRGEGNPGVGPRMRIKERVSGACFLEACVDWLDRGVIFLTTVLLSVPCIRISGRCESALETYIRSK